jgi:hypothetical protein
MSDLEERALHALRREQVESQRRDAAAQHAKAEFDELLRARMAVTAIASVESVLGVRTRVSDWKLYWGTTNNGYGDGVYPMVRTEIEEIIVNCTEDGRGQLVCNAGGSGRFFEFSLAGFGRALQYKKDEALDNCSYCRKLIKANKMAAHEEDCYRRLPWHKKLLR